MVPGGWALRHSDARGVATASSANQDQMGADQAIDYTKTKFEEVAKEVDVVLDAKKRSMA